MHRTGESVRGRRGPGGWARLSHDPDNFLVDTKTFLRKGCSSKFTDLTYMRFPSGSGDFSKIFLSKLGYRSLIFRLFPFCGQSLDVCYLICCLLRHLHSGSYRHVNKAAELWSVNNTGRASAPPPPTCRHPLAARRSPFRQLLRKVIAFSSLIHSPFSQARRVISGVRT